MNDASQYDSSVEPSAHVEATVVPNGGGALETTQSPSPGSELSAYYTHAGELVMLPAATAAEVAGKLNLLTVRYDLDDAYAECVAAHRALDGAFDLGYNEAKSLGYQRNPTYSVMNDAMGRFVDAWRHFGFALGALVPMEGYVASLADHMAEHGSLDAVPGEKKYEDLALAYLNAQRAAAEPPEDAPTDLPPPPMPAAL